MLGGRGKSFGDELRLTHYYRNDTWYDDISDGPIMAEIVFDDGSSPVAVEPAWVIVAPPDFAPSIHGIVTLHDLLYQVGHQHFGLALPTAPSFTQHIYPILKRTIALQWVHEHTIWSEFSSDFGALSDASCQSPVPELVVKTLEKMHQFQNNSNILDRFSLLPFQKELLQRWLDGAVQCDWHGVPAVDPTITPDGLTQAALEAAIGARLHPGIEGGGLLTRKEVYVSPFAFRLSHDVLNAGDVTAYMALPWQADFWECRDVWWPSQRPDIVRSSAVQGDFVRWADGVSSHIDMVRLASSLGMLRPKTNTQGDTIGMIEEGRSIPRPT